MYDVQELPSVTASKPPLSFRWKDSPWRRSLTEPPPPVASGPVQTFGMAVGSVVQTRHW